ncbi:MULTISPECIES: sulfotransferase family 2 domain-containing protein [Planktothrix]|uniref:sulfotransferase family 2 domain-containing protein n=1 Tax=Planktothrix TaxID=54304 RepID=UPI0004215FBE|nr:MULTISPECIES: sulfotransferase family 2 domain-containing protein [Planktothrix]
MNRTILVHHHIFKNAGTSFNHALQHYFGSSFLEYDLPNSQVVTPQDLDLFILTHPQALAISSHHASLPTPQGENYQTISSILLRKPLARIRSIYQFEQQQNAQTEGAIKAKELDFKDYVLWRLEFTPVMFCNYQTYYCSRTQNSDQMPMEDSLQLAIENLKNCFIVGTVERYSDTLKVAQFKLSSFYPDIDLKYSYLNRSTEMPLSDKEIKANLSQDLGDEIVEKIDEMNKFDQKLYKISENILEQNLTNDKFLKKM